MILEWVFDGIFTLISSIIGALPQFPSVSYTDALDCFFPLIMVNRFIDLRLLFSCVLVMLASLNVELIWGMIEWVYKKIPGVE